MPGSFDTFCPFSYNECQKGGINMISIEKWGTLELEFKGMSDGNPFDDYAIQAEITNENEKKTITGFYDGDGVYKVRFMPMFEGEYQYRVYGSFSSEEYTGSFTVTSPSEENHGPVRAHGFHFFYDDGKPYYEAGTTCYVWVHQNDDLVEKTLETLSKGYFNKIRFCIFPKHYLYNLHEPVTYPYEGTPCDMEGFDPESLKGGFKIREGNKWDYRRFVPEHFRRIDRAVIALRDMSIEADIILFHPYDRWGFSQMAMEDMLFYLRYAMARYSAFRNIWWSMANEFDLLYNLSISDWEKLAMCVCENDPYHHLRSIHNCHVFYDHSRGWVTHSSIQHKQVELTDQWRIRYQKPVVIDEMVYEGDINQGWGNITGQELVRRFWESSMRGGYAGHGETFDRPDGILWWSHGGVLHGESPERIRFLRGILEETPGGLGLKCVSGKSDETVATPEKRGIPKYFIYYYGNGRSSSRKFHLDDETTYEVEIIDTWNMTIENAGKHKGLFNISLPGRPYMAIRLREV